MRISGITRDGRGAPFARAGATVAALWVAACAGKDAPLFGTTDASADARAADAARGSDASESADAAHDAGDASSAVDPPDASTLDGAAGDATTGDATTGDATTGDATTGDAAGLADAAAPEAAAPEAGPPQALVRVANWAPDAPSVGYDVCLAPHGTTTWFGPLLATKLPAGSLGAGSSNGIQFPSVSAYVGVVPGQYDLQLVQAGTPCTAGVLPITTGLPTLVAQEHVTIAVTGDVDATDDDSSLKVGAFVDETTPQSPDGVTARFIPADPGVAAVAVGKGDLASHTFLPIWPDVLFASTPSSLADGTITDVNGYVVIDPLAGVEISAHAVGATTDLVTAAHATAAAGSVVTIAIVNGENGGLPPQFLLCNDNRPANGSLSQCAVLIGE